MFALITRLGMIKRLISLKRLFFLYQQELELYIFIMKEMSEEKSGM